MPSLQEEGPRDRLPLTRRSRKSKEVLDLYATAGIGHRVTYPASWPYPTDAEFRAKYTREDVTKLLKTKMIGKFSG